MKLSELKIHCDALNLSPVPTRSRIKKDTGERYLDFCSKDYIKALQDYYINKRIEDGKYHRSLKYIL